MAKSLSPELRVVLRETLKRIYFSFPARLRPRLFSLVFRVPLLRRWIGPLASKRFIDSGGQRKIGTNKLGFPRSDWPRANPDLAEICFLPEQQVAITQLRVGVIIHAYYPELLAGILAKLHNIPLEFKLYITAPNEHVDTVAKLVAEAGRVGVVTAVENIGYDLYPFLNLVPDLIADEIDVVCKLHTKKGAANLEGEYPGIETIWSDLLLQPILGSQKTVSDILAAFVAHSELGMLGSASLYKSAVDLMYGNEHDVSRILNSLGCKPISENWGFFAGSMFWCRVEILKLLPNILDLSKAETTVEAGSTGKVASYWHALERVFGALPGFCGKQVGLSFATDIANSSHAICFSERGDDSGHANPFPIGLTLAMEMSLAKNLEELQLYLSNNTEISLATNGLGMDPPLFYLRYGVFLGSELLDSFNSEAYWLTYHDVYARRLNPLIHFIDAGQSEGRVCFPARTNIDAACRIVEKAGLFDRDFYLAQNPDDALLMTDPLRHYCEVGWMELRDPCATFDTWNYWQEFLNPCRATINPAVHQAVLRKHGESPVAKKVVLSPGHTLETARPVRRVCLFAGYDPDDIIDEAVLRYVRELSRFADVFYLSDGFMPASELLKLEGTVKGAWSIRHGAYDFGSYAKLALELVGWDTVLEYDEMILANDSCYLLRSFDEVFEKMDRSRCDWWGLQATKGLTRTRWKKSNRFKRNIPLSEVKSSKLEAYEKEDFYDFLVASYFIVFRQPVLQGPELKPFLASVRPEANKLNVIRKYEIGLTRKLINSGYNFETFIDDLFTFHPVYSENHFALVKLGFPLFKRFFLTENHYQVPELWRWEQNLLSEIPNLDLESIKANLRRHSDPEKLHRNLHIKHSYLVAYFRYPRLISGLEFAWRDRTTPKEQNWWVFPVCAYDHLLTGNERALFEHVRNDPAIKKIVLVRKRDFHCTGENVEVVPLRSRKGQEFLIKSRVIFIKHTLDENVVFPLNARKHDVINLWHGVPLKRIGYVANDLHRRLDRLKQVNSDMRAVICSSDIDRLAMACAFYPLTFHEMWVTGLPRNDFILASESSLPPDMIRELKLLETEVGNRRLLLFCPTFRNDQQAGYYQFSSEEKEELRRWLDRNGCVLGIREHMAAMSGHYLDCLSELPILDLGSRRFRNIEVLYRKASLLLTDYSSCLFDFMLTGNPVISFAYDEKYYAEMERGLYYELEQAVPGPVCRTFQELMSALEHLASSGFKPASPERYEFQLRMFHKFTDGRNSERVTEKVRRLTG